MLHNKVSPREVRLANFHLAVEEDSIHDDDYEAVVEEEDKIERRRERSPPVVVVAEGSIHDNIHDDVDLLAVLVLVHTGDDREADLHSLY